MKPLFSLVLATNNKHKVVEIQSILRKARLRGRIYTLQDFPKRRPPVENKATLLGNAAKKAKETARATGMPALADDTGLFIDALKGKPGVYSARFAGPGCTFDDNNNKVLHLMRHVPLSRRGAQFRCVAALADPAGHVLAVEGVVKGVISLEKKGRRGFGYDPIFCPRGSTKTFAQMPARLKNNISHRARAFSRVPALIKKFLKVR